MKTALALLAMTAVLPLAGCYSPGERALGGAALGGATGALVGTAVTGGRASGALVGAAVGAAGGAAVGAATAPQRGCAQWGYDRYGNAVCAY